MDGSESNPEEVPEEMANLSRRALDGMDPDDSKELESSNMNMEQLGKRRAKRYMREKLHKRMATGSGTRRHRSNMKWACEYLPQDLPLGIVLCTLNRPPGCGNWVGRYDGHHDPTSTESTARTQRDQPVPGAAKGRPKGKGEGEGSGRRAARRADVHHPGGQADVRAHVGSPVPREADVRGSLAHRLRGRLGSC